MLRCSPFGRCHFTHGYTRRVVFHYKYNPISIQNKKPRFVRNRVFKRLEGYARLSEAKGGEPSLRTRRTYKKNNPSLKSWGY